MQTKIDAGDPEKSWRLVSPAHIRSGVVSLYSESHHQSLNIYDSPILVLSHDSNTVYLTLDTGATTSLAKEEKVRALGLKILPTSHRAVQVDGKSTLKVVGEVHTLFTRGTTVLPFSALVVAGLVTDFLAGTNFIIENDVTISMAKKKVTIGDTLTLPTTPITVLQLDRLSKHNLVSVTRRTEVHPGDTFTLSLPTNMAGSEQVLIEPNLRQTKPFFPPSISKVEANQIRITNTSDSIVNLKKNTQVAIFTTTVPGSHRSFSPINNIISPQPTLKPLKDVLKEMVIDGSHKLSSQQKQPFLDSISRHLAVFGNDLPGYNHHFGKVYASFEFATKTKPKSYKLRKPSYGHHAERLFNQKCLQMKQQNVLADPAHIGIQPLLLNNAWIVKKASAGRKPWEECSVKDVRVVVGFDFLNKYLQNPPGEVTKPEKIFASVASWKYMAEIDAKDCYFQIPLRMDARHKKMLAYMCIKTALGTLCFTRAAMGLLGMDVFQDEMMQRIFGDLILDGKLITLADNIYFGADTLEGLSALLEEVLSRCEDADLRIKPSKVHINLKSADILGLHWSAGTLSPSPHKLEPLAHCDRPKTVSALRSFIGGVRFQEICLPGPELALASQPLDAEIPASRSGKELITWTPDLVQSFQEVQKILKNPLHVTVPRKGDTPYIVSDGCTSIPAGGTKLFLKRPGVEGFLASFHHGCRLPKRLKEYSPCEIEAYFLHQGVSRNSFFIKMTGEPGICLVDSKAVFEAKQRMDNGFFSSSRRLQDFLANLSTHRMSVQLISAKLPSPLLQYIDFSSRHPVECTLTDCRVCLETQKPDTTVMGMAICEPHIASAAGWRDIQRADGDLRQACSILTSGTKLSTKKKHAGDVKKYLRLCKVNKEGLLVVEKTMPFQAKPAELLVIPRAYAPNLCRIIHNKLDHPVPSQMKKLFSKSYFTLDSDAVLKEVYDNCEVPCQASRILPKETMEYKTETKPLTAGSFLNADVMEEARQKVLVLRDNLTSYTSTAFIPNQTKDTLRDSLLILASRTRLNRSPLQCRVDAHSSLKALAADGSLEKMGLLLEVGHPKNPNHNSVAETAIKELRQELVKLNPHGGPASEKTLALATENLNSRIRHLGRSAKELWTSRDQVSGANLSLDDQDISDKQHAMRVASHPSSATYASRKAPPVSLPQIHPGQPVFIKSDRCKSKARDKYMVLSVDSSESLATLQKLPMSNFKSNLLQVQLQNLYPTRTPHQSRPAVSPNLDLPINTTSPTKHLSRRSPPPNPPRPILSAPAYPRLTPDSSDSEDDDISWLTQKDAPTPEVAAVPPGPIPVGAGHVPDIPIDDVVAANQPGQTGGDEVDDEVSLNEVSYDEEDSDALNDAVSIHGDEDLVEVNNLDGDIADATIDEDAEAVVNETPQLEPFTEALPMVQPKVKQKGELKVGDVLLRFSKKSHYWEKVRLTKKFGKVYRQGSYKFEYTNLDGSQPRRNFFSPGAFWSLLREDEIDLDLDQLVTDLDHADPHHTSEDDPEPGHLAGEAAELLLEASPQGSLMVEQPRAPSASSPSPIPNEGAAALAQGGGPQHAGNDHLDVLDCPDSLLLMFEPLQSVDSTPLDTPNTSPDTSLLEVPKLDSSSSHTSLPPSTLATPQTLLRPYWDRVKAFLRPCGNLARTLLGSVSHEQPRAATPPAPVPTPTKGAAALAWVRGPPVTGNLTLPLPHTDCSLLMSELMPLPQMPLTPSVVQLPPLTTPTERKASDAQSALKSCSALAHSPERYASDAQSALGPLQKRVLSMATSHERLASDAQSALRLSSATLTHSLERNASDAQSALGSFLPPVAQFQHLNVPLGSVASEQSRTTPPTACAQIPPTEAAAFASVRRPLSTGKNLSYGDLSDHLIFMSELVHPTDEQNVLLGPELHADYFDLFRHTSRLRSASFHATRSPDAVAMRAQDSHPLPPGCRDRQSFLERHRHWSTSGTDLHPPDFEAPYRLL